MKIRKIDHIGIIVQDLAAAKEFFLALGMVLEGEMDLEGDLVDRVTGLRGVRSSICMLQTPEGDAKIELCTFHAPAAEKGERNPASNAFGIRHITFLVEDLDAAVDIVKKYSGELVGEIQNYKNVYKLCYVRGPEGIILELAEEL